jgi:hypothetical protein
LKARRHWVKGHDGERFEGREVDVSDKAQRRLLSLLVVVKVGALELRPTQSMVS